MVFAQQDAALVGAIMGGLMAGAACGMLPVHAAKVKNRNLLGFVALITCAACGALLGCLLALPVALIFTLVIRALPAVQPEWMRGTEPENQWQAGFNPYAGGKTSGLVYQALDMPPANPVAAKPPVADLFAVKPPVAPVTAESRTENAGIATKAFLALIWAVIFYFVASVGVYVVINVQAGAAGQPLEAGVQATREALQAWQVYLIAGAVVTAILGAALGLLPGSREQVRVTDQSLLAG